MNIKRSLIGFLIIIMVFFTSCDVSKSYPCVLDYQDLSEKTIGVEILYVDDDCDEEILYIFEENEISGFLEEFCVLSFHKVGPAFGTPYGYTIKLLYDDGSFNLISAVGGSKHNEVGKYVEKGPCPMRDSWDSYYNLLLKHIEIDKYDEGWNIISNK